MDRRRGNPESLRPPNDLFEKAKKRITSLRRGLDHAANCLITRLWSRRNHLMGKRHAANARPAVLNHTSNLIPRRTRLQKFIRCTTRRKGRACLRSTLDIPAQSVQAMHAAGSRSRCALCNVPTTMIAFSRNCLGVVETEANSSWARSRQCKNSRSIQLDGSPAAGCY